MTYKLINTAYASQPPQLALPEQTAAAGRETTTQTTEEHEAEGGGLGTLGINGSLLLAQLLNFAIILFVLWRWVLAPVARRLQERTERIEKSLQDAQNMDVQKAEFDAWRKEEMAKVRQEAGHLVNEAKVEAGRAKEELLKQARAEQEEMARRAERQILAEKEKTLKDIKAAAADLVTASVEKILGRGLSENLDKSLIEDTLKKSN